jgi:hypothetical protein
MQVEVAKRRAHGAKCGRLAAQVGQNGGDQTG